MCLSTLDTETKKDIKFAYKVLILTRDGFRGPIWHTHTKCYKLNKWHKAKCCWLNTYMYISGFHSFINLRDARKYAEDGEIVVMVEVRDILATGKQTIRSSSTAPCVVSRYMKILQIVKTES
jgi:hypothetical protein